ncbi:MAG: hypothetical protein KF760_15625 [Candidatus Eremiobacteraeota bacterium]|nr:hypothetical protein [Candidatus Eremiobacteraeota bacterium]MCW5869292.1 hypothetical protein [Candidatus Eremiobacteraeota bacterium]
MQKFIETTIQALQAGTADAEALVLSLSQLNEQLEEVETQYSTAPEEEEELRLALLQVVRLYQLSLDLLSRYLELPDPNLLERARQTAREATARLDEMEAYPEEA